MRRTALAVVLILLAAPASLSAQTISELTPRLPHTDKAGGRVHAIAVHPASSRQVVIATEFGGLWKTDDGTSWFHLDGLDEIFVADVAWTNGGSRLVAAVSRGNLVDNGGGLWYSDDGGGAWSRATGGGSTSPAIRMDATALSVAPDEPQRVYAATTFGVGTSDDGGASWSALNGGPTLSIRCMAVQALPRRGVVAICSNGIYRRDGDAASWRNIRTLAGFTRINPNSIDLSPVDRDELFFLQNYDHLLLYEIAADRWTDIPLRGGGGRLPIVKVARGPVGTTQIFAGSGRAFRYVIRNGAAEIRSIAATDWVDTSGAHSDCGDVALGPDGRVLYFGSDGGLFRTSDGGDTWTRAASGGRTMNSLQITDLHGTNIPGPDGRNRTALYFATQDNSIWGSTDNGVAWTNADCPEGFTITGPHAVTGEAEGTVGYGAINCGGARFADFGLRNPRHVPDAPAGGGADLTDLGTPAYLSPWRWVRVRASTPMRPFGVYVSTDNGATWRRRADVPLEYRAGVAFAGSSFFTSFLDAGRIGLVRIDDVDANRVDTFSASDLIRLDGLGSLGQVATMFDWHTVFAVDPTNRLHIIAPDIVGGTIRETVDGGRSWTPMIDLTNLVTDGGRYRLYDADPYHMEVTLLKFDPYRAGRLWVGTRDNGLFVHEAGGDRFFEGTRAIKYITGVASTPGPVSYVSSYGRGLWKVDETPAIGRVLINPCAIRPILCIIRFPPDPEERRRLDPREWVQRDVALLVNGRIVGIDNANGPIAVVEVTPGAYFVRPNAPDAPLPFQVVQTANGHGFASMKGALAAVQKKEVIDGLVLEGGKLESLISMQKPLVKEDVIAAAKPPAQPAARRQPRILLTGDVRAAGMPVASAVGGSLAVTVSDLDPDGAPAIVLVDGVAIDKLQIQPKGEAGGYVKLPPLEPGKHTFSVQQKNAGASSEFLVAEAEGDEARSQ